MSDKNDQYPGDYSDEQASRQLTLMILSGLISEFGLSGAAISTTNMAKIDILEAWDLDTSFELALETGQVIPEDIALYMAKLNNGSPGFASTLSVFSLGEVASVQFGPEKLLGGLTFYSEPANVGNGSHSGIFFFVDGRIGIQHGPRCVESTSTEIHNKLYAEFDALIEETTEYEECEQLGETGIWQKGYGRIEVFIERWPTIFELATHLP